MNIPRDIFTDTHQYLFIIFLGLVFTFIYNYFSSLLRALGNSKIPLIFLALASIINIGLDIYLVAEVAMGVAGAAVATLIAQAFSAIGIMLYVFLSQKNCYRNENIGILNVKYLRNQSVLIINLYPAISNEFWDFNDSRVSK